MIHQYLIYISVILDSQNYAQLRVHVIEFYKTSIVPLIASLCAYTDERFDDLETFHCKTNSTIPDIVKNTCVKTKNVTIEPSSMQMAFTFP